MRDPRASGVSRAAWQWPACLKPITEVSPPRGTTPPRACQYASYVLYISASPCVPCGETTSMRRPICSCSPAPRVSGTTWHYNWPRPQPVSAAARSWPSETGSSSVRPSYRATPRSPDRSPRSSPSPNRLANPEWAARSQTCSANGSSMRRCPRPASSATTCPTVGASASDADTPYTATTWAGASISPPRTTRSRRRRGRRPEQPVYGSAEPTCRRTSTPYWSVPCDACPACHATGTGRPEAGT